MQDPFNILDVSSSLLLLAVLPARFAPRKDGTVNSAQWGLYSAAYALATVRILKFAPIFKYDFPVRSFSTFICFLLDKTLF